MTLDLQITTGNSTPIYRQIVDQVRLAVATGALAPGDALPSVREAAARLIVNPNTVARAYGDLARDGILEAQPGKGLFVAPRRLIHSEEERRRRLDLAADQFVQDVLLLGFSPPDIWARLERKLSAVSARPDVKGPEDHDGK